MKMYLRPLRFVLQSKLFIAFSVCCLLFLVVLLGIPENPPPTGDSFPLVEEVAVFESDAGQFIWRFFPKHAPLTVANIKKMVAKGHYNGSHLYRAEKNFCLQGGLWSLRPAPFPPIKLEYNLPNKKTFISMARGSDPNSASSEFSIMLKDNSHWLSPQGSDKYGYAVFAQVFDGWQVIEKIMQLPTHNSGQLNMLDVPVKIRGAYLSKMLVPRT